MLAKALARSISLRTRRRIVAIRTRDVDEFAIGLPDLPLRTPLPAGVRHRELMPRWCCPHVALRAIAAPFLHARFQSAVA
jgi:hypothetical protein